MFFDAIKNKFKPLLDISVDSLSFEISQQEDVQEFIISLNTEGQRTSQLYELGQNSLGQELKGKNILVDGGYTPFTIEQKKEKGQVFTHPTLKDTGGFYRSFRVVPFRGGFTINANPNAGDTNLFDELGEDIVGLNDDNLQLVINEYKSRTLLLLGTFL